MEKLRKENRKKLSFWRHVLLLRRAKLLHGYTTEVNHTAKLGKGEGNVDWPLGANCVLQSVREHLKGYLS